VDILKINVRNLNFKDTFFHLTINPTHVTAGSKNKFEGNVAILKAERRGYYEGMLELQMLPFVSVEMSCLTHLHLLLVIKTI
jgi:hypothetical protein